MPIQAPPLGPGTGNLLNYGTSQPYSYFQRSEQVIQTEAINTVFLSLLGSNLRHETNLAEFTTSLNECNFFVQIYDNATFVGFGAIKLMNALDIAFLSNAFSTYGNDPWGYPAWGGGFSFYDVFGEICYVYQNPAYVSDNIHQKIVDQLIAANRAFVSPTTSRKLFLPMLSTIPSSHNYDFLRYFNNGISGVTSVTVATLNTGTNPYRNIVDSALKLNIYTT